MSAIKGVDCSIQKGDGYQQNPLEKSYFIVKITDPGSVRPSLKWLDTVFQGQYLPSLSINYLSNRKRFPCLHSLIQTREGLGEFETACKPETKSRVCITVENSPNASSVYIRLCKHRKKFSIAFIK